PGEQYATLAAAVAVASDGDTIDVTAGTYTDDFVHINKDLTIEGIGGMAHFVADEPIPNGKAILIVNADVTDGNGAGIRHEGGNLILNNDYFHDNEEGILGGNDLSGNITINNSEFAHNGAGDGLTH